MTSEQMQRLADAINRTLAVFGENPLPDDAGENEVGLIQAVEAVASRFESSRLTPGTKAAMANRLHRKDRRSNNCRIVADAASIRSDAGSVGHDS